MNRKGYGVWNLKNQKMEGHRQAKLGWLWEGECILKFGASGSLGKPQVHSCKLFAVNYSVNYVCKLFAVTKRKNLRMRRTGWAEG